MSSIDVTHTLDENQKEAVSDPLSGGAVIDTPHLRSDDPPRRVVPFIWYFVRRRWPWFLASFLFAAIASSLTVAVPWSIKLIIDGLDSFQGARSEIFQAVGFAVGLFIFLQYVREIFFRALTITFEAYLAPRFGADIRLGLFEYLQRHSHSFFMNNYAGALVHKITNAARASQRITEITLIQFVTTFFQYAGTLLMIWLAHEMFFYIFIAFVAVMLGLMYFFLPRLRSLSARYARAQSRVGGSLVDATSNIFNIKSFARSHYEMDRLKSGLQDEIDRAWQYRWQTEKMRILQVLAMSTVMSLIMVFEIQAWSKGEISLGDFALVVTVSWTAVIQAFAFAMHYMACLDEWGVVSDSITSIIVPHDIRDRTDAKDLEVSEGGVTFKNVDFAYDGHNPLFAKLNIKIEPKEKIGLVGFSGAGKTTLVNLLLRFYDIQDGKILIDGQNVAAVTQNSLHENISVIPQEPLLFHRSLMENIRYGSLSATDEEVIEAARKAHVLEFVEELPEGFGTIVGDRGIRLSGGQRQRIAIARAMLKDAPILVLDEATAALDTVTEKKIQQSLDILMEGKTVLVIAHRLSTLLNMDRLLVFENGQIVESGTHDELVARDTLYSQMWDMQSGGFLPDDVLKHIRIQPLS